ncbi:unnamed protein product [Caenorhabditis bovis]|uniref:Disease resistance R13L4/SHOC-2-like LRR domain-containing protein n=1 Tax=Caenorhabditis bovis TaxID=2654633 RepID=A0A8S1ESL1_9PELO|nr:unnamed protein product [Caenorhabditis bovis]
MGIDSYNPTVRARLSNAPKTRILNLKESALHRIPDDVEKMFMIRTLNLSINYLITLPSYIRKFTQLKTLDLSRNPLESLPDELGLLTSLENLIVNSTKVGQFPNTLSGCENLKNIEACEIQLVSFPVVFCELKNVETLLLTGNRIDSIPDEIRNLKAINVQLNKNRLRSLNAPNLKLCERLRVLNVDNNQLSRDEIENLVLNSPEIKISFENNVSQVHTEDLQEMGNESSKSKSLGESARKIVGKSGPSSSTVNKHLEMATKSRILQLKGSGLKKVPEEIEKLADILRNLDLSDNKIRIIPTFIGNFSQLKQLHLANNCIEILPDKIGHLKKLEILNLAGNKLSSLPDTLAGCTELKSIDISSNSFTIFPAAVFTILQFDVLNLDANQLQTLPDEICQLKVIELSMNQNRLQSLNAENLLKCPRLRTLRVEENCLEKTEFTRELLENSAISRIAYQGNLFQMKEFQDLNGYDTYQERFTATQRKM